MTTRQRWIGRLALYRAAALSPWTGFYLVLAALTGALASRPIAQAIVTAIILLAILTLMLMRIEILLLRRELSDRATPDPE